MDIDAIVYTSNAGHTKAYAEMLGEKTGLKVYELQDALKELAKGSKIIYLGWLMAGTIKGYKEASERYEIAALCPVGMTAGGVDDSILDPKNKIPEGMKKFYLQGGFELSKLHGKYWLMMSIMRGTVKKNLKKVPSKTPEEEEMLQMMTSGVDTVSEDKLAEILEWYHG